MKHLKILFLCTGNSCRSQMAEGWTRELKGELIDAYSAGTEPHEVNPLAVAVMKEVGVNISHQQSKHVNAVKEVEFDYVVTVCDRANAACPTFPAKTRVVHVGFDDPPVLARNAASREEELGYYRRVRDEIRAFIENLEPILEARQREDQVAMATVADAVRSSYGAVAASDLSGDHQGVRAVAEAFGYSKEQLDLAPAAANMGLSCGNPTEFANLRPGEVLVDLGCGGGLDVLLAAEKLGPSGRAIGIDMTPEMIDRARRNAASASKDRAAAPVEFHLALIDRLPLPDASADVVISNCVINLALDKQSVFREIARVLKPGGRLAISDIALKRPLPREVADDVASHVGCVGGAMLIEEYERRLREAGLTHVSIVPSDSDLNVYARVAGQTACCSPPMKTPAIIPIDNSSCRAESESVHGGLASLLEQFDIDAYACSVSVRAVRP